MMDKKAYYESATKKLLSQLDSMDLDFYARLRAKNLTLLFRDSFKLQDVKQETFTPEVTDLTLFTYPSDGFCAASSYSFQKIMGDTDWSLMYIDDIWTYGPHHFLRHNKTQQNFDLTFDQYTHSGIEIPYYLGKMVVLPKLSDYPHAQRFSKKLGIELNNYLTELDKR